jgi:hypothetical protein
MDSTPLLTEAEINSLRQFDTCMVANAIETFNVRLRNMGFTEGRLRCIFPDQPPMIGYGDQHGIVTIPPEIASQVSSVAAKLQQAEQNIIQFCRSSDFSIDKLSDVMRRTR